MKRKTKGGGDCYYIAGQFAMDNVFSPKKIDYKGTPYLVHAEVQGQGKISNLRYGHAWIEDDENVYDFSNGRELIFPKLIYYAIGNIKTDNPKKYQKYTFSEARKRMLQYKHYGCWDLDVEYKDGGEVEFEDNRWEFNLGDCGLYAIALHRVYGFPIYVCKGYFLEEDEDEMEGEVSHAVVKLPNGNYLDHDGELTEKQLLKNTYYGSNNKQAKKNEKIEPVTEKQAKLLFRCGSGESRCPDMVKEKEIQEVVKYIMKKKFNKKYTDIRYEIGGIFQGTPHEFDRYSTQYVGTGEGQQVFGWGLYFTDQKDVANYYKNAGLKDEDFVKFNGKKLSEYNLDEANKEQIYGIIDTIQREDKVVPTTELIIDYLMLEYDEENYPEFEDLVEFSKKTYNFIKDKELSLSGNIYSVTLFKGDNESDYDLLLWDSAVNVEQLEKIFIEAEKIGGIPLKEGWYFSATKQSELTPELLAVGYSTVNLYNERSSLVRGHSLYNHLANELGSDKEASLFLLRSGIDGIKYKVGTLSGMEDKEGYNYVIFDANEVTIENKESYKGGGLFGGLDNIEVKIIEDDSLAEKVYDIVQDDLSVAVPRLALIENGKVIGGIYLEPAHVLDGKREPLWEYKFDIYIKRSKRKKGYSKLLLDAMIKDFVDNFPDADQIRGEVINNRLEKSLIKNYGFNCDSGNQEEITYCYLSREDAIDYLKRGKFLNGGKLDNVLSIEEVEQKLGRELHWWNDDIVYLSGIEYKKVYLRPEYKKV